MQMHLWQDGLVAALAAIGLVALLWGVSQAIESTRSPSKKSALALFPVRGDGGGLQEQISALIAFGRNHGIIGRILVVDCGLTEDGQKLCRILERENRWVIFCRPDEVAGYLTNTT